MHDIAEIANGSDTTSGSECEKDNEKDEEQENRKKFDERNLNERYSPAI